MPTHYCLLLDATAGSANQINGDFDLKTLNGSSAPGLWVSYDSATQGFSQLDSVPLPVANGDFLTIAVRIKGAGGEDLNAYVKWLAATVNDMSNDPTKIDSPFQLANGGVWPLIIMNPATDALQPVYYDSTGLKVDSPSTSDPRLYVGFPYLQVMNNGAFKLVVAAEVAKKNSDNTLTWFQLSHDPEIDNGKGGS